MLGVVTAEQLLRVGIGSAKPLTTAHAPPGALSKALLPAVSVASGMSLTEPGPDRPAPQGSAGAAGR